MYQGKVIQEHAGLIQGRPRTYVEELDAKIEKYMMALGDLEVRSSMPDANKEALLNEITVLTDSMLRACAQFEQDVNDPLAIKQAQVYFREKTHPILSKSYAINRCRTWPQGQQGDFMTLELAYKNMPMSEGIGYYLDKYFMSTTLGVGVQERVVKMRDLLKEELISRSKSKVLDVACGSCREVFELAPDIKASGAKFTCVDLDPAALDFALDRFSYAGLSEEHTELIQYNALRMFDLETAQTEFGMRDIIYSIGFFDYLPDNFLVKLLNSLYKLLNPGGKLIASFKDANRYRPELFQWLVDWDGFLQRNETDFERVFRDAEIPSSAISMTRVDSGSIVFYSIAKQ
jgi:SAM-dependent methyltransferase